MDEVQPEAKQSESPVSAEAPAKAEAPAQTEAPASAAPVSAATAQSAAPKPEPQKSQGPRREDRPREDKPREDRGARPAGGENRGGENRGGERRENRGERPDRGRPGGDRGGERREGGGRPGGGRPFEGPPEIDVEKLISDSLYLDNQAHAVVARMRDMDSGTKSQLRRLYNAVRRAVRAPESERQHQFVMLRARLAYTIARHSLRSLDALERLLLQVTRKNDARGYERFKDLFEAIVAYNE
jgi:CRISPR type III-A-associated protein Csm2